MFTPEARKLQLLQKSLQEKERSDKYRKWKKELDRVLTDYKRQGIESKFNRLKLKQTGLLGTVQQKWIILLIAVTAVFKASVNFTRRKEILGNAERYSRVLCLSARVIGKFRMVKVRIMQTKAISALRKGRFRLRVAAWVKNFRIRKANLIFDFLNISLIRNSVMEFKNELNNKIITLQVGLRFLQVKKRKQMQYWLKLWDHFEKNFTFENMIGSVSYRAVSSDEKLNFILKKLTLVGRFDISMIKEGVSKLNYNS